MNIFFKSKEEKEEIQKKKELQAQADREKIRNSCVTQSLKSCLKKEFSDNGTSNLMSEFRKCKFAILSIYKNCVTVEIYHKRKKDDGKERTVYVVANFENLGYSDINSTMVSELANILYEELICLDCMRVSPEHGSRIFMYPIKKEW